MSDFDLKVIIEDIQIFWAIRERRTNIILGKWTFEEDAIEYLNFLEAGGAFFGWTPKYMMTSCRHLYEENI